MQVKIVFLKESLGFSLKPLCSEELTPKRGLPSALSFWKIISKLLQCHA